MKYITITLVFVLSLASCVTHNNFSKRKYTKGKFRPKAERLVSGNERKQKKPEKRFEMAEAPLRAKTKNEKYSSDTKSKSISDNELSDYESESSVVPEVIVPKERDQTTKKEKVEDPLTRDEKRARWAEILGYTSASASVLLYIAIFTIDLSYFFLGIGIPVLILRAIMLIAGIGVLLASIRNEGEVVRNKFQKARRRGLYFSAITFLFWLLLLI